ncbi:MAG: response regulator transcription factor [Anaerolineaceae bacterium]|nr:response regulator transcription factor [Anaerolineaceae bacterium]
MPDMGETISPVLTVPENVGIDLDQQELLQRKRILVIDDDTANVNLLKRIFISNGYNVSGAASGAEALKKLTDVQPSLVILDLLMPEMSGEDTLTAIHQVMDVPVIVLSAVGRKETVVQLLQNGVDDYITKPFDELELLARVNAVLRRSEHTSPDHLFIFPSLRLKIDLDTYEVNYHDRRIQLTGKMFEVLALLARNAPRVVNYQDLTMKVWGENTIAVRNRLKYLVYLLRKEFLAIDPSVEVLENIDRLGYRLCSNIEHTIE